MKLKIIIKGKVHNVGYRVKLITIALEYGIDKFNVFNTFSDGRQAVVCLVEAEDRILEEFKKRVKEEKPEKALVEEIKFESYGYDVPPIERCMQAFQMEHWGKAIPIMLGMLDRQDSMLEKQDRMLEKQEETIRVIREEGEKTREVVKEESEKTRRELTTVIREESKKTRQELGAKIDNVGNIVREEGGKTREVIKEEDEKTRETFGEKFIKLEEEVARIKEALIKAGIM